MLLPDRALPDVRRLPVTKKSKHVVVILIILPSRLALKLITVATSPNLPVSQFPSKNAMIIDEEIPFFARRTVIFLWSIDICC